jgi:hypothetical protein
MLLAVVLVALVGATGDPARADDGDAARYRELRRVIDRNVGHGHMTRGANMYTVIALRECVSERDIPLLTRMLEDRDHVTQLAVARVLSDFGEPGLTALREARAVTRDARARGVIDDALWYVGQPEHRPLGEYPLTPEERRRIRGCAGR